MDRMNSIVVGVDFSEASRQALHKAAEMARRTEATLYVIHVVEALVILRVSEEAFTSTEEVEAEAHDHLEAMVEKELGEGTRPRWIQLEIRVGIPVDEIARKVKEVDADLLVLGSSGITSAGKGTGVLAAKCVRKVPTRVLLVRPEQSGRYRNILACVDFSTNSFRVVKQAVRMALQNEARLTVIHVFSGPWNKQHYRQPTEETHPDFQRQYRDLLLARLAKYLESHAAEARKLDVHYELADFPHAGVGIVDFIRHHEIDLVVLGNKGHSNLTYVLMGTTAERIIRDSTASVLALKPAEVVPRVKNMLDKKRIKYYTITHSPAYTSQEVAASARVPGRQFAKTVMVKVNEKLAMVVLPASKRIDFKSLRDVLGSVRVSLADEDEFEAKFTDCEPGAMPPFGNLYGMDVYVADSFCHSEDIIFNAGSHSELIQMKYTDFEELVRPKVAEFVGAA